MEVKEELFKNIDKIHTTEMGKERIKRNLKINTDDIVMWCVEKIKDEKCIINRKGKNYYAEINDYRITINAYSFTIITAHMK